MGKSTPPVNSLERIKMADPQQEKTFRLEGFQDSLGFRESRENESAGRMAAGANVEPVDAEWWMRPGFQAKSLNDQDGNVVNVASMPWWAAVDKGTQAESGSYIHIFNPFYCLQYRFTSNNWGVRAAYLPSSLGISVSFTNGSDQATRIDAASVAVGQLLLVNGDHNGNADGVYRVIAYSDPIITLDRDFTGVTGNAHNCSFVEPIADPKAWFDTNDTWTMEDLMKDVFGWAVMDQVGARAGSTLGYTNSATVDADQYLIITSRVAEPVAINMSDSSKVIDTDFFRDTADAAPSKILRGWTCCTFNDQLIVGHAGDNLGSFTERSVWVSQPWDYQIFHANTQGENGKSRSTTRPDHTDPILRVETLGQNLILHRSRSQDIGSPGPDESIPLTFTRNNQGFGAVTSRSVVAANNVHYLWTQVGPAVFDGVQVAPLALKYREYLKSLGLWGGKPLFGYDDRQRSRVCWVFNGRKSRYMNDNVGNDSSLTIKFGGETSDTSLYDRTTVVVFDYTRSYLWIEDTPAFFGAGIRDDTTFLTGARGLMYDMEKSFATSTLTSGKDQLHDGTEQVVPAFVETPWFNLGNLRRKHLHTLLLELRTLATDDVSLPWNIQDLWTLESETIRYCTVDVLADHETDIKQTLTGSQILVSTMMDLTADADKNHPIMLMQLSPRVSGGEFKLRIHNLNNSGVTQGHFRVAAIEGVFQQEQSTRYRKPLNK